MDRFLRRTAIIGLIALLFAAMMGTATRGPATVTAQGATPSPAASPVTDATITTLMERTISPLPTAPLTVRLLRITLEPGASVPLHTHPGPELDYVESGTLTVEVEGEAQIVRANGEEVAAPTDEPISLATGDWITFPAGTAMGLSNPSDQPVGPDVDTGIEYVEGEPTAEDFAGVTPTVLGDGLLETAPEGDATVSVQRVEIPSGSPIPASDSPVLLSRIEGNLSFAAVSGSVQVTRTADPGLRPEAVPDEEFTLATGDAAFFPNGHTAVSREGEAEALSVYRVVIDPAAETEGEPAEITILPAEEVEAAATPAATPG
ncbi:MAG: cupin domain-containing protein, partial [Chloroflexota bacterium]|nr:cupin domain-containing protein [Chloroflexota bacterium]